MRLTKLLKRLIKAEIKKYEPGESHHGAGSSGHQNYIPRDGHQPGDKVRVRGNNGRAPVGGEGKKGLITSSHGSFHMVSFTDKTSGSYHESDLNNLSRH